VVIAYLLTPVVRWLEHLKIPHFFAVMIVYFIFLGALVYAVIGLMPMLWKQLSNMVQELPKAFSLSQTWLTDLMHRYPKLLDESQFARIIAIAKDQSVKLGQEILRYSIVFIPNVVQMILYFILVPLLVFFFLKDGKQITTWLSDYMPSDRSLVMTVWHEVREKISAYVGGRVVEVIVVGVVSTIVFDLLGLQYAGLLGAGVGLSVIIPYIGAVVITIPIVIVGLVQWGLSTHFLYLIIAYAIIILLDANLLVPILFSEVMDLHPAVIILSVVIFGSFWGFWGVFFAIPLATLVHAVLKAWPRQ